MDEEEEKQIIEATDDDEVQDPQDEPIKGRTLITQPYDLSLKTLFEQVKGKELYLRPLHERPHFQRFYVWSNKLASLLIESIFLQVPIPPCYFSQNSDFTYEVIDGQQRIFSIYRFLDNQFKLTHLEVLKELNGSRFHELEKKMQRQLETYVLRCIVVTNNSSPEIQFDVFERLNSYTVPLNAQELRNCMFRGQLNDLINELTVYRPWLGIINKIGPDKRMRDAELILRFFAFHIRGYENYKTPQKHWLNEVLKEGRGFSKEQINELGALWTNTIDKVLVVFSADESFRRWPIEGSGVPNKALMDLVMYSFSKARPQVLENNRAEIRSRYSSLFQNPQFVDLISKSVDHKSKTLARFRIWQRHFDDIIHGLL